MKIFLDKNPLELKVKPLTPLGKFFGLMFRSRKSPNLLFEFSHDGKWPIHSFFVFQKFLAIWLDEKNTVVEHQIVKPFRPHVIPKKNFRKLIEVPITDDKIKILNFFDDKERFKYIDD